MATPRFAEDPYWRELLLFNEYFYGDNGGVERYHRTGRTALVVRCFEDLARADCVSVATRMSLYVLGAGS